MPDFIVKVDGLKLSKAAEASLAREIQSAALRELAKIDTGGDLHVRIPNKIWRGIWAANRVFSDPMPGRSGFEVNEIGKIGR